MIVRRDFLEPFALSYEVRNSSSPIEDATKIEVLARIINDRLQPVKEFPIFRSVAMVSRRQLESVDNQAQIRWLIDEAVWKIERMVEDQYGPINQLRRGLKELV